MVGHRFLSENGFEVQKCALDVFLKLLKEGVSERMGYSSTDFFAFKTTGGSNLDPEDELIDSEGNSLTFTEDVCPKYDLILAITDFSLTAPLTAMAKNTVFVAPLFMASTRSFLSLVFLLITKWSAGKPSCFVRF